MICLQGVVRINQSGDFFSGRLLRIVKAEGKISAQALTSRPARRLPAPAGFEGASVNHGVAESASGHAHSPAGEQAIQDTFGPLHY